MCAAPDNPPLRFLESEAPGGTAGVPPHRSYADVAAAAPSVPRTSPPGVPHAAGVHSFAGIAFVPTDVRRTGSSPASRRSHATGTTPAASRARSGRSLRAQSRNADLEPGHRRRGSAVALSAPAAAPVATALPLPAAAAAATAPPQRHHHKLGHDEPRAPIAGVLRPRARLGSKTQRAAFFRSRVLLLLCAQFAFYVLGWLLHRHIVAIPWHVVLNWAFIGFFFAPLSSFFLLKFARVSPINYLFVVVYDVFTLPYFFAAVLLLPDTLLLRSFALCGAQLAVLLVASFVAPRATTFARGTALALLTVLAGGALFCALAPRPYVTLAAAYVAVTTCTYVLYYINYLPCAYNYTDYVPAFVDFVNLLTAARAIRRMHLLVVVFVVIGFAVALLFDTGAPALVLSLVFHYHAGGGSSDGALHARVATPSVRSHYHHQHTA